MKYRNGFVSNSSSSSFVCIRCGSADEIYDGDDISEYGFIQCEEENHITCKKCLGNSEFNKLANKSKNGYIHKKDCPICNLKIITDNTIIKYIEKKHNHKRSDIEVEIIKNYKNLDDFNNDVIINKNENLVIFDDRLRGLL